jgi:hypothetical protein
VLTCQVTNVANQYNVVTDYETKLQMCSEDGAVQLLRCREALNFGWGSKLAAQAEAKAR